MQFYLKTSVVGVYPAKLPSGNLEAVGTRAVLAGYGTLVDGISGISDSQNSLRVGGENSLDRVVSLVDAPDVESNSKGGLLAIDFDSSNESHNTLSGVAEDVDYLGSGTSTSIPQSLNLVQQLEIVADHVLFLIIKHGEQLGLFRMGLQIQPTVT